MAATQAEGPKRVSDSAIIHTTMGDIHIKLFPVEYVSDNIMALFRSLFYTLQDINFDLLFLDAPKRWRTSVFTAGTDTTTATSSTELSRSDFFCGE